MASLLFRYIVVPILSVSSGAAERWTHNGFFGYGRFQKRMHIWLPGDRRRSIW